MFEENIHDLNIEELNEDDWELKFFTWSRKIQDEIFYLKEHGASEEKIREYLQKCADLREKFLDRDDLTEIEESYMEKIKEIWEKYGVSDPMWD